ncbi:hypothetical protein BC629DRAFT_1596986 [Irpex lacteus]|nr:hypothetical protein BC629DRAFT_1596986 [Irpex lacteus]
MSHHRSPSPRHDVSSSREPHLGAVSVWPPAHLQAIVFAAVGRGGREYRGTGGQDSPSRLLLIHPKGTAVKPSNPLPHLRHRISTSRDRGPAAQTTPGRQAPSRTSLCAAWSSTCCPSRTKLLRWPGPRVSSSSCSTALATSTPSSCVPRARLQGMQLSLRLKHEALANLRRDVSTSRELGLGAAQQHTLPLCVPDLCKDL